jgi:hypothetical protein
MRELSLPNAFYFLAVLLAMCQYGCSSCNTTPKPTYVDAQVILQGEVGSDCNFLSLMGSGGNAIRIWVTDSTGNVTQQQFVSKVPNFTYAIQVPTKGPFQIEVMATDCSSLTCPACAAKCPGGAGTGDLVPLWAGTERSQLSGAAGGIYAVTMHLSSPQCTCC